MRRSSVLLASLVLVACVTPRPSPPSDAVAPMARAGEEIDDASIASALDRAGPNRAEIERYLARYASDEDVQKRLAARWLVANMPGHGFTRISLMRPDGTIVPFDVSEHRNLAEAQAELDRLGKESGPLSFRVERFDEDLRTLSADDLIANQELAFASWRAAPWAASISFATFLEHILPYRGSSEPFDPTWRPEARERLAPTLAGLAASLGRDPTLDEAAPATLKAAKKWVKFRPLYYLHPTDQSWSEMAASKAGRCEDQSNAAVYAARSVATVVAGDFTPFWADRDNNHAWEVVLDEHGAGSVHLAHRPAKVFRRTFGAQPGSLGSLLRPGERAVDGLAERGVLDVTSQYVSTSDIGVSVGRPPGNERFAYLCVFNGGAWHAVHFALVEGGDARFADMGREVLYLPAWRADNGVAAASAPFLLHADGSRTDLCGGGRRQLVDLPLPEAGRSLDVWSTDTGGWTPVSLPAPADGGVNVSIELEEG